MNPLSEPFLHRRPLATPRPGVPLHGGASMAPASLHETSLTASAYEHTSNTNNSHDNNNHDNSNELVIEY